MWSQFNEAAIEPMYESGNPSRWRLFEFYGALCLRLWLLKDSSRLMAYKQFGLSKSCLKPSVEDDCSMYHSNPEWLHGQGSYSQNFHDANFLRIKVQIATCELNIAYCTSEDILRVDNTWTLRTSSIGPRHVFS